MAFDSGHVILPSEAEICVQSLKSIDLQDIGSSRWSQQHEYLEKLNMQAVFSASQQQDEFVKEFLITHEKISLLVQDVLTTEVWKENIFPVFVEEKLQTSVVFPLYIVLYHEATVANLLETVMYHRESAEAAEDSVLDLLDYCYRKISYLVSEYEGAEEEEDEGVKTTSAALGNMQAMGDVTSMEELEKQKTKLDFDIGIKAVSMMRYITDHLTHLPLAVMGRALDSLDVPLLLVSLIESPPWTKETNGKLLKYIDNKWEEVSAEDRFKLTKTEGQVWLALYQLLMSEECQRKYELNTYRKNVLLKLRSYLGEVMLDQIPCLGGLRHYLEQLSVMEPPAVKRDLVLEQIPEIKDTILRTYEGHWKKIARKQSKTVFNPSNPDIQQQAKRLADTYNFDVLESLITDPPKCASCGAEAAKRCSRCQNEWYCRRECQVNHWKKHKKACDLLVDSLKKIKEREAGAT